MANLWICLRLQFSSSLTILTWFFPFFFCLPFSFSQTFLTLYLIIAMCVNITMHLQDSCHILTVLPSKNFKLYINDHYWFKLHVSVVIHLFKFHFSYFHFSYFRESITPHYLLFHNSFFVHYYPANVLLFISFCLSLVIFTPTLVQFDFINSMILLL